MKVLKHPTKAAVFLAVTFTLLPFTAHAELNFNQIAFSGETALGTIDEAAFDRFGIPRVNDAGDVAFLATLRTGSRLGIVDDTNNVGFFGPSAGNGSPLGVLLREGWSTPEDADVTFQDLSFPRDFVLNGAGQFAFFTDVTGEGIDATNDFRIYGANVQPGGDPDFLLSRGDVVPGTNGTLGFMSHLSNDEVLINDAGGVVFQASLDGDEVDIDTRSVLLWQTDGPGSSLSILARSGNKVLQTNPATRMGGFSRPQISRTGDVAFTTRLRASNGDDLEDESAIFRTFGGPGSGLELLIREGEPAPGVAGDVLLNRSKAKPEHWF